MRNRAGDPGSPPTRRQSGHVRRLNYEELKLRANAPLSGRIVATLEASGTRRLVSAGETLVQVDDRQYPFIYSISATLQIRDPDGMIPGTMDPGQFTGASRRFFGGGLRRLRRLANRPVRRCRDRRPGSFFFRIENFLGFPIGLSGADLAFRAELQAIKFGANVVVPRSACKLQPGTRSGYYEVALDDDTRLLGRAVVIATGARHRKLGLPGEERFTGAGLYYAATELEARPCNGQEVGVVGGGNSAGQAAMFLATRASRVRLVHRGQDLANSMSQYLIERLRHASNVSIETSSQVVQISGNERLRGVGIRDGEGRVTEHAVAGLFVMIGADPCTGWLKDTVLLDDRGFVLTGEACGPDAATPFNFFPDQPARRVRGGRCPLGLGQARRIRRRRGFRRRPGDPRPTGLAAASRSIRASHALTKGT